MSIGLPQQGDATYELAPYKSLDNAELQERIAAVRAQMGSRLLILGHHYQQDEVIALPTCGATAISSARWRPTAAIAGRSPFAASTSWPRRPTFWPTGPSKLAERGGERVTVVLPDMAAGCSMADMAAIDQVEGAWEELGEVIDTGDITPVTYINSAASLKAFCGRHGGIVCTSSNAAGRARVGLRAHQPRAVLSRSAPGPQHGQGDGHSARADAGLGSARRTSWAATRPRRFERSKVLLWNGHCSVHQMFTAAHVDMFRDKVSGHQDSGASGMPDGSGRQGRRAGLDRQDHSRRSKQAPPGTKWAIGTELHLVNRLKHEHPEQEIHFLSPVVCMCATMYRIDLAHLCWSLENLAAGTPVNVIRVDDETARWSLVALERMLAVK